MGKAGRIARPFLLIANKITLTRFSEAISAGLIVLKYESELTIAVRPQDKSCAGHVDLRE